MRILWVCSALLLLSPVLAEACTLCHTDLAQEVRAIVFGEQFSGNLAAAIFPFFIIGGIARLLYGGSTPPSKGRDK